MKAQLLYSAQGHAEAKEESRFFLSEELAVLGVALKTDTAAFDGQPASLRRRIQACELTFWLFEDSEAQAVAGTAAACFACSLEAHGPSSERAAEFCRSTGEAEEAPSPVMLPRGCTVFANGQGRFPGFALSRYGQTLIALPGSRGELIPLFTAGVIPFLSTLTGQPIATHTVGVFGTTEAAVKRRLADILTTPNPLISLYAKGGECLLRITAKGGTAEEAAALCDTVTETVRSRLEPAVYGVDAGSLPAAVVALLKKQDKQIATAESCTAGLLSGMLTGVPGASAVFQCGVAAYSCDIKQTMLRVPAAVLETYGAVSPQTAGAMAEGVRAVSGAAIGIGITGVAGPDASEGKPVGTVYIALADDKRTWVKAVSGYESFDRETVRQLAAASALDLTRRYLEALPAVMAGGELRRETPAAAVIPEAPPEKVPVPVRARRRLSRAGRVLLWTILPLLLVFSLIAGYLFWWTPLSNQWEFERLQGLYQIDSTTPTAPDADTYPAGMLPQFYSLYSENPAVRGWLHVDGTPIDYPVMDASETDYARYNFAEQLSEYGVPYFSSGNTFISAQSVNRNLTVFGNNTGDGQMFSSLTDYFWADTLIQSPILTLDTLYHSNTYTVFAVMITTGNRLDPDYFDYSCNTFSDDAAFLAFTEELQRRSLFQSPVTIAETDSLLLLCTDASKELGIADAQVVVCARVAHPEDTEAAVTVTENRSVLVPQSWLPALSGDSVSDWLAKRKFLTAEDETNDTDPAIGDDDPETEPVSDELLFGSGEASQSSSTSTTEKTAAVMATTAAITTTTKATTAKTTTEKPTVTTTTADSTTQSTTTTASTKKETTTKKTTVATTTTTAKSSTTTTKKTTAPAAPEGELTDGQTPESDYLALFRLKNSSTGVEYTVSTPEDLQLGLFYLVKKELGSARSMQNSAEAQKAQAVASYTYVLRYCAANNKPYAFSFPSYTPTNANDKKLYDAVGEVLGVKLLDLSKSGIKNQLCDTMYFASSCGVTATSNKVYTGALPYLKSVKSPYDNATCVEEYFGSSYPFSSTLTVTWDTLLEKVADELGIDLADLKYETKSGQPPLYAVSWDGGEGHYVYQTNLYYMKNGKTKTYVKGHEVRQALGTNTLRSHAFTVTDHDEKTGKLTLSVTGWGHGVGMSQTGAVGYANEAGWTYDEILRHYYSVTASSDHQLVAPKWS